MDQIVDILDLFVDTSLSAPIPFGQRAGLSYTIHLYEMARNNSSSVEREQFQRIGRRYSCPAEIMGFLLAGYGTPSLLSAW
jgi:hypothetical protein